MKSLKKLVKKIRKTCVALNMISIWHINVKFRTSFIGTV